MKVKNLIEILQKLPQDARLIGENPEASFEGLGHCYEPKYLHLTGFESIEIDGEICFQFSYSHKDEWEDFTISAIDSGLFFTNRNLNKKDFIWKGDELPKKDGLYLCICQHGIRYTVEEMGFYAEKMPNGEKRKSWGFSCEHIPLGYGSRYQVALWSKKSFKPFGEVK